MKIIYDLSLTELKRELETLVEKMPRFRAGQIFSWMNDYKQFDEMSNVPSDLKEVLKANFDDEPVKIERELVTAHFYYVLAKNKLLDYTPPSTELRCSSYRKSRMRILKVQKGLAY